MLVHVSPVVSNAKSQVFIRVDESRWTESRVRKAKVQTSCSERDLYLPPSALLDAKPMSHARCVICSPAIDISTEDVRLEAHRLTENSEAWAGTCGNGSVPSLSASVNMETQVVSSQQATPDVCHGSQLMFPRPSGLLVRAKWTPVLLWVAIEKERCVVACLHRSLLGEYT